MARPRPTGTATTMAMTVTHERADEDRPDVVDALAGEPAVGEEDVLHVDLGDEGPRLLGQRADDERR